MRTLCATAGEGRLAVTCQLTETDGNGLTAFVFGGELPHVGGQALANPGPTLHGERLSRVDMWTAAVPGHKDAEAAAAVARELCLATGQPVSVVAGIHVDNATAEEIRLLGSNALRAARACVEGRAAKDVGKLERGLS